MLYSDGALSLIYSISIFWSPSCHGYIEFLLSLRFTSYQHPYLSIFLHTILFFSSMYWITCLLPCSFLSLLYFVCSGETTALHPVLQSEYSFDFFIYHLYLCSVMIIRIIIWYTILLFNAPSCLSQSTLYFLLYYRILRYCDANVSEFTCAFYFYVFYNFHWLLKVYPYPQCSPLLLAFWSSSW